MNQSSHLVLAQKKITRTTHIQKRLLGCHLAWASGCTAKEYYYCDDLLIKFRSGSNTSTTSTKTKRYYRYHGAWNSRLFQFNSSKCAWLPTEEDELHFIISRQDYITSSQPENQQHPSQNEIVVRQHLLAKSQIFARGLQRQGLHFGTCDPLRRRFVVFGSVYCTYIEIMEAL